MAIGATRFGIDSVRLCAQQALSSVAAGAAGLKERISQAFRRFVPPPAPARADSLTDRMSAQAQRLRQGIMRYGVSTERVITQYVINPARAGFEKAKIYVENNKGAVIGHVVAWTAIILLLGCLHGLSLIGLRLLIGFGPGMVAGLALGFVGSKLLHRGDLGRAWTWLNEQADLMPEWTRTLALSAAASVFIFAASLIPFGIGVCGGLILGGWFSASAASYDPNQPRAEVPTTSRRHEREQLSDLERRIANLEAAQRRDGRVPDQERERAAAALAEVLDALRTR